MHFRHSFSARAHMGSSHFNMPVSASTESLYIISTCLLNLNIKFTDLKFSGFIMNIYLLLLSSLLSP